MTIPWKDARRVHLLTRGNVDGITSAALVLARFPDARVDFVTNATVASQYVRRDLGSDRFILIDLGLTSDLARNLSRKARSGSRVAVLDHHEQTLVHEGRLDDDIDRLITPGMSAAAVTRRWLALDDLHHLGAIADVVEYCQSPDLVHTRDRVSDHRLYEEARMLDFAWRLDVSDDRFRAAAARRLAKGLWPSEIPEVAARDRQMQNERRWERALDKVRAHLEVRGNVAVLSFNKRKPSLFGFGSRALTEAAREAGCAVAVLVHRRDRITSFSVRQITHSMEAFGAPHQGRPELNLGRFIAAFTAEHGIVGGGHPESAGGKIPTRSVPTFLEEIECFA